MIEMMGYEVFVAAYADEGGAHHALHTLEDMDKAGSIEVIDATFRRLPSGIQKANLNRSSFVGLRRRADV
ncbi:MAG: hypothetical protein BMS9Abin28_1244 [Anaerolineae bacterium]|nr:MAG: hypothetical protein BMS9Abin28_1244 [Anaerolineae bacterium]